MDGWVDGRGLIGEWMDGSMEIWMDGPIFKIYVWIMGGWMPSRLDPPESESYAWFPDGIQQNLSQWMDGSWMGGRMEGWMEGWMDEEPTQTQVC